jgi:hypothetical protein
MPRVMVLTTREDSANGVIFDGNIRVPIGSEGPFVMDALEELREEGYVIKDGDLVFFPEAHPNHRTVEVEGDGFKSLKGWN